MERFATAEPVQELVPAYDKSAERTLTGVVEEVVQLTGETPDRMQSTSLTLHTGIETVQVRLGPSWYLQQKQFLFFIGDKLEITGSKASLPSDSVITAREVKSGDRVLTLRDADGAPLWAASSQRAN